MTRRGFTLIELLVVICILSILISLSVVAIVAFLDHSKANATEALLQNLTSAAMNYAQRWGDYPPTSIADIGGRPPNDLNNGIETLAACLSSKKRGTPLYFKEGTLCNMHHDHVDRNLTDWEWGTNELFEYQDYFGNALIYFHSKDYAKPKKDTTRSKFSEDGAEFEVAPELHPVSKNFTRPRRFQLRSVGADGKPGTGDDITPDQLPHQRPPRVR